MTYPSYLAWGEVPVGAQVRPHPTAAVFLVVGIDHAGWVTTSGVAGLHPPVQVDLRAPVEIISLPPVDLSALTVDEVEVSGPSCRIAGEVVDHLSRAGDRPAKVVITLAGGSA